MIKSFTPVVLRLCALFLPVLFLESCIDKPGAWKNEQISSGKRADFHHLNDKALALLKDNDAKDLKVFLSKELIDDNAFLNRKVDLIHNRLTDNAYEMMDEYYVINKSKSTDTIIVAGEDENNHLLTYEGKSLEMYLAFFLPKKSDNKYLITLTWCKLDYGWKITKLDLGPYTINGKTAPELLKLAKDQYDKKYLIDASNNAGLVSSCLLPSDMWHYPIEAEADSFYKKTLKAANDKYKFPFTIYQVHTRPQIIRVYSKTTPEGSFPTVYYLTDINMKDTTAIKNENAQIRKVIGQVMPGIDKDKKYVYYMALSQVPTGRKVVSHFDMVDKRN